MRQECATTLRHTSSGMDFPVSRITVNLAPADIRKEGPLYDLPILIALLSASRQITTELSDSAFLGELSLGGGVRRVTGVLPMLLADCVVARTGFPGLEGAGFVGEAFALHVDL